MLFLYKSIKADEGGVYNRLVHEKTTPIFAFSSCGLILLKQTVFLLQSFPEFPSSVLLVSPFGGFFSSDVAVEIYTGV